MPTRKELLDEIEDLKAELLPRKEKITDEILLLDGIQIKLTKPDLDGDGKTGGVETLEEQHNNLHTRLY